MRDMVSLGNVELERRCSSSKRHAAATAEAQYWDGADRARLRVGDQGVTSEPDDSFTGQSSSRLRASVRSVAGEIGGLDRSLPVFDGPERRRFEFPDHFD